MEAVLGIDVGGTSIKAGLFTPEGELLEERKIPTPALVDDAAYAAVTDGLKRILDAHDATPEDVIACGLDIPGPVADDGTVVNWYPQEDLYGDLILPASEEGRLLLFDFSIYTNTIAIDHPEGWEPSGDDWWWPPTDLGLADTSWDCDEWTLELHYGDCDPDYAGLANLYECYDDRMDLRFFGV